MKPIFRAKKLDSDDYVSGYLVEIDNEYFIVKDTEGCYLASDCFHYFDKPLQVRLSCFLRYLAFYFKSHRNK